LVGKYHPIPFWFGALSVVEPIWTAQADIEGALLISVVGPAVCLEHLVVVGSDVAVLGEVVIIATALGIDILYNCHRNVKGLD
jgi:hypothetical protein